MAQLTFLQMAERVLREENRPLSADEIWQVAATKGYDALVGSRGKTPWSTVSALIYVDMRDNPGSPFMKVDSRPRRFFLKALAGDNLAALAALPEPIPQTYSGMQFLEADLHPFVAYYAFHYMRSHVKTIRHNRSDKRDFGEWVHPDMVGCHFPFADWKPEVVEFSAAVGNVAVTLYSFELKRELNFANLREAFFQAVSNSSWANEGYLASADISANEDFASELQRLSSAFGIGVIRIDVTDPDSTEVVLPARTKEAVDWETVNKLATLNPDFKEFLKRIRTDLSGKEVRIELYDKVLGVDALVATIRRQAQ